MVTPDRSDTERLRFRPLEELESDASVGKKSLLLIKKIDPLGEHGTLGVTPGYNAVFYGGIDKFVGNGCGGIEIGQEIRGVRVYQSIGLNQEFYNPSDHTIFLDRRKGLLLPFNYGGVNYEYRVIGSPESLSLTFESDENVDSGH